MAENNEEVLIKQSTFQDLTFYYTRFLKLIGLLPIDKKYGFLLRYLPIVYSFLISFIHWSMYLFYFINMKGVVPLDTFCETVLVIDIEFRYYMLLPKRNEFIEIISKCENLWDSCSEIDRHSVIKFERKMRKLFNFLLACGMLFCFMYTGSALAIILTPNQLNGTDNRVLPYKWFVEDPVNLWPGYTTHFIIQIIVAQCSCFITATVDCAAPFFIMIACGYLRDLRNRLLLLSNFNENESNEELIACFKFHQSALDLCSSIEKLTRTLFLVQIIGTGLNISLIAIKIAGPDPYKYLPFWILLLGQLYICQWAPDYLTEESEAISSAAYFASVNYTEQRDSKLLIIMIARAQKSVQITAGGLIHLSLESYGKMLKTAMSFFMVLREMIYK